MNKLTVKELEALQVSDDGRTLREDGGIVARVRAGVKGITVAFRFEFKLEGVKRDHALGSWPKHSLAEIRSARDKVKATVATGINPSKAKKAAVIQRRQEVDATLATAELARRQQLTLDDLFATWIYEGVNRSDGNKELQRAYAKNIQPHIGKLELRRLTESRIRAMLKPEITAGKVRKAQVMLLNVKQMLNWAEKRQPWRSLLSEGNPAALISEDSITPPTHESERDRILSPEEIHELAVILQATTGKYANAPAGSKYSYTKPLKKESQLALWIALGTICRIGELLMSRWEDVNLQRCTWFIPKENVKGRRGKKQDQLVYLSPFVLEKFKQLYQVTGDTVWCFPAKNPENVTGHVCVNSVAKQVGDRQIMFMERKPLKNRIADDSLVLSKGERGNWTPHDLRRTGATMMQAIGVPLEVIDRCQNHVLAGSKVRRHYLHHDYAEEKKSAWDSLGTRLSDILHDQ